MKYEIIVVGGGHAGCEAALASAKKGHKTLLVTGRIENIATMPCNPSIGGSAKGIVVREIEFSICIRLICHMPVTMSTQYYTRQLLKFLPYGML